MEITKDLVTKVNERLVGFEVIPNHVKKNNVEKMGLTIIALEDENKVCPTVYIDDLNDFEDVFERVSRIAEREIPSFDVNLLTSRDYILSHVRACVCSKDNVMLDDNLVYRPFLDMAIYYRIVFDGCFEDRTASCVIRKEVLEKAGLEESDLFEVAKKSVDYKISTLFDTLAEMVGEDNDIMDDFRYNSSQFYVLTSKDMIQGASVIITDLLAEIREKMDSDFYILPSSIHEVLLVPCREGINAEELVQIVREVNATQVLPEDRLTDSVYYYGADGLRIAA